MKEDKNETRWDKLLQIRTMGRDDSSADQYRYPYEPTPYSVLERLADSGRIRKGNTLLDYGCGKGRVDFFCRTRPDAGPSVSNMTGGSMRRRCRIKKRQSVPQEWLLSWPMRSIFLCREPWIGFIFSIHFPWRF